MTSVHHSTSDPDSSGTDSITSSPRHGIPTSYQRLRFMCSFGGNILPRRQDNQLRYVGGDTRIVAIYRSSSFSAFTNKLSKLSGIPNVCVKYQLPNEDLDSLISVTTVEDMENMMEEYDRAAGGLQAQTLRFRLFLSPVGEDSARASAITSLLDGSAKRENWFLDTLTSRTRTDRSQSGWSSLVSEPADYVFGVDDDPQSSDCGSPAPVVTSSFNSTAYPVIGPENYGSYGFGSHISNGPVYYLPPGHSVQMGSHYVQQPVIFQHVYSGQPAMGMSPCQAVRPTVVCGGRHPYTHMVRTDVPVPGSDVRWRMGPNI